MLFNIAPGRFKIGESRLRFYEPELHKATGSIININQCRAGWSPVFKPVMVATIYLYEFTHTSSAITRLLYLWRPLFTRHPQYSDKASVFRINNKNATGGEGETQFGRAMHELNIQTICAETSAAKGRVERAHLTLQDRLVKELRLLGISSMEAANAFAEEFMNDYNRRFAKAPRQEFDVHRELDVDDDLDMMFNWREARRVSKSLTVQYDKVLYLIEDSELSRRAIGKYIDVWHYPDGHKELRLNGVSLPYSTYDKLSEIDQGAIVDNKRLGRALEMA